jgi:hypothetical protein
MRSLEESWSDTFWVVFLKECFVEVKFNYFQVSISMLAPIISRTYTNMKACILVEIRVALHFQDWEMEIFY